jgi:hypothetical protein
MSYKQINLDSSIGIVHYWSSDCHKNICPLPARHWILPRNTILGTNAEVYTPKIELRVHKGTEYGAAADIPPPGRSNEFSPADFEAGPLNSKTKWTRRPFCRGESIPTRNLTNNERNEHLLFLGKPRSSWRHTRGRGGSSKAKHTTQLTELTQPNCNIRESPTATNLMAGEGASIVYRSNLQNIQTNKTEEGGKQEVYSTDLARRKSNPYALAAGSLGSWLLRIRRGGRETIGSLGMLRPLRRGGGEK